MNIVLPQIRRFFPDGEFILVEQNDEAPFRRGNLLNEAVKAASGEVIILHDIDFYPLEGKYWNNNTSEVFRPVTDVVFKKNDLTDRAIEDIPRGFFNFDPITVATKTHPDYYGGVIAFWKEAFYNINGYSPYYVGWGHEDDDLGFRILHYKLDSKKSEFGEFYLLEHPDSTPLKTDPNYVNNLRMSYKHKEYLHMGIKNQKSTIEEVKTKHPLIDKWILATDFDEAPQLGELEVKPGVWI